MTENEKDYFGTARAFLITGDIENACVHYFKAQEEDANNFEAEFFSAYLGYKQLVEANDASAASAYRTMIQCVKNAVKFVKESKGDETWKRMVVATIVDAYTPICRYLCEGASQRSNALIEEGVVSMYGLGDVVKKEFNADPVYMKEAVKAWKEAIALQRKYWGFKYNGIQPDAYATEIKKVEPSYEMPAKAGCISLG